MNLGLPARLLGCTVPPFFALAALALAAPGPVVAAAAAATGLLAAAAVILVTRPFGRLRAAAVAAARDAGCPPAADPSGDGTADIGAAVGGLLDQLRTERAKLAARDRDFAAALDGTAAALTAVAADWRQPPPAAPVASPWPAKSAGLQAAVGKVGSALASAHRRAQGLQNILADIPDPVLVVGPDLVPQFSNPAADRLFPDRRPGRPLLELLADPVPPDAPDLDAPNPVGPAAARLWLDSGRGGTLEVVAPDPDGPSHPVELSVLPKSARKAGAILTLLARDLSADRRTEAAVRQRHRRLVGQKLCGLVSREVSPALEAVRAQAGLIGRAAKQLGQRDQFLPKVQRILDEVGRQELLVGMVGAVGRLAQTPADSPDPGEVRLRAVADDVAGKLAPAFAERGNTAEITGDAGWLVADPEWVTVLMTGLLSHANQACERATVRLDCRRRSAVGVAAELGELVLSYPGPAVRPEVAADVREPFGRANSAALDPAGPQGFPFGLAVAARVAGLMHGELMIEAGGPPCVRVTLPTRDGSVQVADLAAANDGPAGDGRLADFAFGDTPAEPAEPAPAVAAEPAAAMDDGVSDAVGSWFGSAN